MQDPDEPQDGAGPLDYAAEIYARRDVTFIDNMPSSTIRCRSQHSKEILTGLRRLIRDLSVGLGSARARVGSPTAKWEKVPPKAWWQYNRVDLVSNKLYHDADPSIPPLFDVQVAHRQDPDNFSNPTAFFDTAALRLAKIVGLDYRTACSFVRDAIFLGQARVYRYARRPREAPKPVASTSSTISPAETAAVSPDLARLDFEGQSDLSESSLQPVEFSALFPDYKDCPDLIFPDEEENSECLELVEIDVSNYRSEDIDVFNSTIHPGAVLGKDGDQISPADQWCRIDFSDLHDYFIKNVQSCLPDHPCANPLREGNRGNECAEIGTAAAEIRCRRWLENLMQSGDPEKAKSAYNEEGSSVFKGLSDRAFKRAWASAITNTGNTAWSKPGRKRSRKAR